MLDLPKGARIVQLLQRFVEDEAAPRLAADRLVHGKRRPAEISVTGIIIRMACSCSGDEEKDKGSLRPAPDDLPFQYQAYLNRKRSYRDLPLRYNETSTLFRNEANWRDGLIRVRQFTIFEGHLMCTPEQLEDEFRKCLELAIFMLKTLPVCMRTFPTTSINGTRMTVQSISVRKAVERGAGPHGAHPQPPRDSV